MFTITVTGNLGQDCRQGMAGQTPVTNFSVAGTIGFGDKKETVWVDCALFGNRANALAPYLTKGTRVAVVGEYGQREYEGKTYVTCRVYEVTLLGGGNEQQGGFGQHGGFGQQQGGFGQQPPQPQPQQQPPQGFASPAAMADAPADDDIPF